MATPTKSWKALLKALPKSTRDHVAPLISVSGGRIKAQDQVTAVWDPSHVHREPQETHFFREYTKVDTDGTDWTLGVMAPVKGSQKDVYG